MIGDVDVGADLIVRLLQTRNSTRTEGRLEVRVGLVGGRHAPKDSQVSAAV